LIRFSGEGLQSQLSNKINPEISVVMAVFNEEKYIEKSILSILSQSFKNFEFIIIDDGSTDNTIKIISAFDDPRINLFITEHGGLPKALNFCVKQARSSLIARMDGDDIAINTRLEKQIKFLHNNENCVAVGGNVEVIDKDGIILYQQKMPEHYSDIKKEFPKISMYHSAISFRKAAFYKAGQYNEKLLTAQDQLLFNKISTLGQLRNLSDIVIKYRIHPSAISRRSKKHTELLNQSLSRIVNENNDHSIEYNRINNIYMSYKKNKRKKLSLYYQTIGKIYIEKSFNRFKAFMNLIKSLFLNPFFLISWYNIILLMLPQSLIRTIKNGDR